MFFLSPPSCPRITVCTDFISGIDVVFGSLVARSQGHSLAKHFRQISFSPFIAFESRYIILNSTHFEYIEIRILILVSLFVTHTRYEEIFWIFNIQRRDISHAKRGEEPTTWWIQACSWRGETECT